MACLLRNIYWLFGHPPRPQVGPVTHAIRTMRAAHGGH